MNRPITLIMLAMLGALPSIASAQEPEPDVLRAAPDAGAIAQEYRDIGGRWTGAGDAAMQSLAKSGGTLTNIVTGKFAGLSKAVAIADWSATLGTLSAGDMRGGVSGAVAIAVGGKITAGGAAFFGEAGAVVGGAVGTFFPVIGNIAGTMVGGAVGTTAGGFICAFGYDKYVKDYVAKGVLAGIAAVIDPLPMAEMRAKMDALMLQAMSPQERAMLEASSTFGGGEVQLLDFGTLPYVPVPKQPAPSAATPSPQDQAALTTGNVLAGVRKFSIGKMEWEINGGVATYRQVYPGVTTSVVTARGAVSPNRIEGTMVWTFPGDPNCDVRESEHFVYLFDAENVSGKNQPGPVELRGPCKGTWDKMTRGSSFTAPWRKAE